MTAIVLRGDAMRLPIPDATVDLIVTSPPYFALRDYRDGGASLPGQVGSEPTPAAFVDALICATREMVRVLKPSGSIFVNLGDKYAGGGGQWDKDERPDPHRRRAVSGKIGSGGNTYGLRPKSLIGLPWRYALRCIDDLGLILRAELIWCLSGGAKVYARTPGGDRPIMLRDLARAYRPEAVQLWNGRQWTQVLGWNRTPDDAGALEMELRTGERIGCTPGHRWPTQRGVIRADEIRAGDVIQTTRLPQPDFPRAPTGLPDDDIGWLVGLYIAESSRSEKMVQISGHVLEHARHQRLAGIAARYDGKSAVYQTSENGSTCNLSGSVLLGIIDRYVSPGTAKTKRLRAAAWQRSDEFLSAIVVGYLEGDGHLDAKNARWRLGFTANDEWASDLRTLAGRLGAKISLRRAQHVLRGVVYPGWRGEWRWERSAHHNVKPDGQVVAIRASRARDFFDVGVADDPHLFALASGVLTHNSKPNGLPESVTDRVRRSHEQWFHFTREPRYYSAVDEIREAHGDPVGNLRYAGRYAGTGNPDRGDRGAQWVNAHALGKLPGSVWTVPTAPLVVPDHLAVDHFAAFPPEWPKRLILGWSPPGVCTACGEGRRPVAVVDEARLRRFAKGQQERRTGDGYVGGDSRFLGIPASERNRRITGYVCACTPYTDHPGSGESSGQKYADAIAAGGHPNVGAGWGGKSGLGDRPKVGPCREYHHDRWTPAPTRPAVICDPFGGTGTTAMVAHALGRTGISVDLSADYTRLAAWRTADLAQQAKVRDELFRKPEPVTDGQASLFEGVL